MRKILVTLCLLLAGSNFAGAGFLDQGVTRYPNRVNPFIAPPRGAKPPQKAQSLPQNTVSRSRRPLLSGKIAARPAALRRKRHYARPASADTPSALTKKPGAKGRAARRK